MPASSAHASVRLMSAMCSSGFLPSCIAQCLSEPLQSRFITLMPAERNQSTDLSPSTKPSTSTLSNRPFESAQRAIFCTVVNSPSETRADATSILSRHRSSSRSLARDSFSSEANDTPDVCSPSRKVVSKILIIIVYFYYQNFWLLSLRSLSMRSLSSGTILETFYIIGHFDKLSDRFY